MKIMASYGVLAALLMILGGNVLCAQNGCLLNEDLVRNFPYRLRQSGEPLSFREGTAENGQVKIEKLFIDSIRGVAFVLIVEKPSPKWIQGVLTGIFCGQDSTRQIEPELIIFPQEKWTIISRLDDDPFSPEPREKVEVFSIILSDQVPYFWSSYYECYKWYPKYPSEFMKCSNSGTVVKKPAIYLYPEKPMQVEIRLSPPALMLTADPPYQGSWKVHVKPDGSIDGKYSYLFYEALLPREPELPQEGWVVPQKDLSTWFDKHLPLMGLQEKEITDFKDYWLRHLDDFSYYKIRRIPLPYLNQYLPLIIHPSPTTMIRVILYFEGIEVPESLTAPIISPPSRKGFTVVEWGGILKSSDSGDLRVSAPAFSASEIGQVVLRSFRVDSHVVSIRINSNGCTDKNSVIPVISVSYPIDKNSPHYDITFVRLKADWCKAFLPEGVLLTYNLKEDLGIDTRKFYTLRCTNPIFPIGEDISYFVISDIRVEKVEEDASVSPNLLKAFEEYIKERIDKIRMEFRSAILYAIDAEINRYQSASRPDKNQRLSFLMAEKKRIKALPADSLIDAAYFESDSFISANFQNIPGAFSNEPYGPITPCKCGQVTLSPDKSIYHLGELLPVKGMTRSGPFYHIAGISGGQPLKVKANQVNEVVVCWVFKRDYWHFSSYYVYVIPPESQR